MSTETPDETAEADDRTLDAGAGGSDAIDDATADATVAVTDRDESLELRLSAWDRRLDSSREIGRATGEGLDPVHRIDPVPERAPGEAAPRAEPGVRPWLPVVYGARSEQAMSAPLGLHSDGLAAETSTDSAADAIGPLPAPASPGGRAGLPSLARRERRRATATLAGYGAVCVLSLAGLVVVAVLAFG